MRWLVKYKPHRNSQKRYYINGAVYFVTTNTYRAFPYFKSPVLCDLFVDVLSLCREMKGFELCGYKINPEHVHLLIQPSREFNISRVMHAIKINFSRDANKLLGYGTDGGENAKSISRFRRVDLSKYQGQINENIPKFKWQKSYHDHIVRSRKDYYNHLKYIQSQWMKHDLKENKYCYIGESVRPDEGEISISRLRRRDGAG